MLKVRPYIQALLFGLVLQNSDYAFAQSHPAAAQVFDENYVFDDALLIKTNDGAEISALSVRKKDQKLALPAILQFTIYARNDDRDLRALKETADRGYVGVIAYTRGVYRSKNSIIPYEYDAGDATAVIDWISRQPWSNGSVGMMGGSYAGFTQWAAAKHAHPALKTIVPVVAGGPGFGLPMENNIFVTPNYEWAFHVTNSKTMDASVYEPAARERFKRMRTRWWETGQAYRSLDTIDGQANPLLQKWLQHPDYDTYWQSMVPYQNDFEKISIPVLAIDGYYNDSQGSGLHYLREHAKYRPDAEDYLVIGPYSHFGAQRGGDKSVYGVDNHPLSLFDHKALIFGWFDYILKDAPKPTQLRDKINYFVLEENQWRSAPSLEGMSNVSLKLFLSSVKNQNRYYLNPNPPRRETALHQIVDYRDRNTFDGDFYPDPLVRKELDAAGGLVFLSDAMQSDVLINGSFTGQIIASINKRDMDFGVRLYELLPDGDYVHLSYVLQRASYTKDRTKRQLLIPGKQEVLPLAQSRLISKLIRKGSRFVVYIDVNKNPFAQINYGTGKNVSDETIGDAKQVLKVNWSSRSYVQIPLLKLQ